MRRVVITGMGAITPVGNTVDEMWKSIYQSRCGIDYITAFDTSNCDIKVAAEVKEYNPRGYFKPLEEKKLDRFTQFGLIASMEAYKDAGLDNYDFDRERFSVIFGSGIGGSTIGMEYCKLIESGFEAVSRMTIPINLVNMVGANIAIKLKAYGSCTSVITACATGTDCIGKAFRDIRDGYSDIVAAGASEACINPIIVAGFAAIDTLSKSNNPTRASIPFDRERNGFVMGEGAGTLILEELEHAQNRNAKIYGEVVGYGTTCDAFSLTAPDLTLKQGVRAFNMALKEAKIEPKDISYMNAHGTSTKYNDKFETKIIKEVFGSSKPNVPISSTKSMTGHLMGAAGAIEAIISVKSIENAFIPPTIGYEYEDTECDLDYTVNKGRKKDLEYVLSNSLGFGGHNATIILKKYVEA